MTAPGETSRSLVDQDNLEDHGTVEEELNGYGYCLVDPTSGEILASDSQIRAWLDTLGKPADQNLISELVPDFHRLLSDRPDRPAAFNFQVAGPAACDLPSRLSVTHLDGGRFDVFLVQIDRRQGISRETPVDAVTGLPDRRALEVHRAQWQRSAVQSPVAHAVLFMDLDGFKQINDNYGHSFGDQVLAELASRWRGCVRQGDLVTRHGGDEFVVLVGQVRTIGDLQPIIARLQSATAEPVEIGRQRVSVTVTIGVALAESTSIELEQLLAEADRDMYAAKSKRS